MNQDKLDMFKISDHVFDRYSKLGFEKLSPPEKVFQCVCGLEAEVNNGGVNQFYFNSAGDHAAETVKALETIGANHSADLVRQANALFGEAGPSPDRNTRQKQLDALGDAKTKRMDEIEAAFMKYEDKLGQMLEAYVSKNREAFLLK